MADHADHLAFVAMAADGELAVGVRRKVGRIVSTAWFSVSSQP